MRDQRTISLCEVDHKADKRPSKIRQIFAIFVFDTGRKDDRRMKQGALIDQRAMTRIRLKLLGGFAAQRADGTAILLPTRKTEALLAVLACRPGEKRQREWLMALLWGDRGDVQARHSLNQALTSIRRACDDTSLLVAERDAVTFDGTDVEIDVALLRRPAGNGGLEALRATARLYAGPLLDGLRLREAGFEEWLGLERRELHDLAIARLTDLARQEAELGDRDAAVAALDRALALDPLNEALHRRVIQLHLDD